MAITIDNQWIYLPDLHSKRADKYYISKFGIVKKVRSNGTVRYLIGNIRADGYIVFSMDKKRHYMHRLVAKAFCEGDSSVLRQVNHKNGIKIDNWCGNLEWVSQQSNLKHALDTGLKFTRMCIDTQTGIYYNSLKEAAFAVGVNYRTLSNRVNGHHRAETSIRYV